MPELQANNGGTDRDPYGLDDITAGTARDRPVLWYLGLYLAGILMINGLASAVHDLLHGAL